MGGRILSDLQISVDLATMVNLQKRNISMKLLDTWNQLENVYKVAMAMLLLQSTWLEINSLLHKLSFLYQLVIKLFMIISPDFHQGLRDDQMTNS